MGNSFYNELYAMCIIIIIVCQFNDMKPIKSVEIVN